PCQAGLLGSFSLSLHDALPISTSWSLAFATGNLLNGTHTISARATDTAGNTSALDSRTVRFVNVPGSYTLRINPGNFLDVTNCEDRKSTRLNSSHVEISYAVFC